MNERLVLLKQRMREGEHKALRQAQSIELLPECENERLSWPRRVARLVRRQCQAITFMMDEIRQQPSRKKPE